MSARPRIALIGCGRIGHVHAASLATLRDHCELAMIADPREDVVRDVAERLGIPRWSADAEDAIADPAIDAVIVASSTETHAPYIETAARHGKDVFTEKPIALDIAATDRALAAVEEAGVRLQVGFQRRFDRGYAAAHQAVAEGSLGRIEMIRDAMRDPQPPDPGYVAVSGGLYRDMTIHNFDCVRWLMGEEPEEIYATASALVSDDIANAGDVDTSVVTLRFPSGSLATIENSRRSGFGYDVRTEIFGSAGAIMVGESRQTPIRRFSAAGVQEDHQYFFLERFREAYRQEMDAFLGAILTDTPVSVTGTDGRAALLMAYAAERSLQERRPVGMDEVLTTYRPQEVPRA
ncbi:MAG TPA: inositol 2-dehydrogenase [Thermomicrobiales bacterium]|jgi:myo-inositol 2-dehydrogenase/D-chiro-inositol 1-dehydrogenase|nr:inositol 2-dehydrogenase [Thermomicrobiales bacterium]